MSSVKVLLLLAAIPLVCVAGTVMQTVASRVVHAVVLEVLKTLA